MNSKILYKRKASVKYYIPIVYTVEYSKPRLYFSSVKKSFIYLYLYL